MSIDQTQRESPALLAQAAEPGPAPATVRPASGKADFLRQRLVSLDAYRGLIMVTLAFVGFGLADTARLHLKAGGDEDLWKAVRYQFSHVEWTGCGYWDMIQPSFMFMVGVAAAFSYARRSQQGYSRTSMFFHALWRSLVLVFLGIFLISNWSKTTNWSFMNVLTQIGLGYPFLFLLWGRSFRTQAIVAAAILVGTWLLYVLYPHSGIDLAKGAEGVGVSATWAADHLKGIAPAWHKNANVGHAIDVWLLNLLPLSKPFVYNKGGYQTINFIPSLATMLFGLMCGELLRSNRSASRKLLILTGAGLAGLLVGWLLAWTGICPLVKRIWTPSWVLYSTGWCCLILAGLFAVIDVLGYRRWAFPLVVVGVNSLAIYCMGQLLKPWTARTFKIHCGEDVFQVAGKLYAPTVEAVMVGMVFWLICLWMYRQKVFIRV
jgi:heparan-alpha-glucosaminide N-acetyltransferase